MDDVHILGIETSCDETAAAVVKNGREVLSDVIHGQQSLHTTYGGVVPELASRCHIEVISGVVRQAIEESHTRLEDIDAIAVTQGPGMIGALLVGVSFAKALAYSLRKPVIAVNHLDGHLASARLGASSIPLPHIALVVSGGHTNLYAAWSPGTYEPLGRTLDDAAGEAFDKGAKMLGLGYPGGPIIDRLARMGNPQAVTFPLPYPSRESHDFSFSGIKTALLYMLHDIQEAGTDVAIEDIAAGYQRAIVDVLVQKTINASCRYQIRDVVVVGGVAANSRLRRTMHDHAMAQGFHVHLPPLRYCTDNGAMIAAAGWVAFQQQRVASLDLEPFAHHPCGGSSRNMGVSRDVARPAVL